MQRRLRHPPERPTGQNRIFNYVDDLVERIYCRRRLPACSIVSVKFRLVQDVETAGVQIRCFGDAVTNSGDTPMLQIHPHRRSL